MFDSIVYMSSIHVARLHQDCWVRTKACLCCLAGVSHVSSHHYKFIATFLIIQLWDAIQYLVPVRRHFWLGRYMLEEYAFCVHSCKRAVSCIRALGSNILSGYLANSFISLQFGYNWSLAPVAQRSSGVWQTSWTALTQAFVRWLKLWLSHNLAVRAAPALRRLLLGQRSTHTLHSSVLLWTSARDACRDEPRDPIVVRESAVVRTRLVRRSTSYDVQR